MQASVTDVKNRLSHYLRVVARGEPVVVVDRGRPVAQLMPVRSADDELRALAAAGLVRLPVAELPRSFFKRALPRPKKSVAGALVEEREDRF
ncbi:type II toxin-antitoxin system prevent-host-death family antitoxin [Candidatus Binatia bacterium]|nr:type II toxin-antitoxin system prevent-host-death family antitoxin [Candidatus Binatia bacterium]